MQLLSYLSRPDVQLRFYRADRRHAAAAQRLVAPAAGRRHARPRLRRAARAREALAGGAGVGAHRAGDAARRDARRRRALERRAGHRRRSTRESTPSSPSGAGCWSARRAAAAHEEALVWWPGCSSARRVAVIGLFFVLPVLAGLALSVTDFDLYALADLRNLRFAGLDNYVHVLQPAAVLEGDRQHAVLRGRRRAAVDRAVAGRRRAAAVAAGALQAVLPHRAVRAGGDHAGGGGGDLALPVARALRPGQRGAWRARARARSTGSATPTGRCRRSSCSRCGRASAPT